MIQIATRCEAETVLTGKILGSTLRPGDTVCLTGGIGAGKTAFTRGIAEALGITEHITSPTFTIINEYQADIPLYHFDVYRLDEPGELIDIGFEEYIGGPGIAVIEWADKIGSILPVERINITFDRNGNEYSNKRTLNIEFCGEKYALVSKEFLKMIEGKEIGKGERSFENNGI